MRLGVQEQGRPAAARRRRSTSSSPLDIPAIEGHTPNGGSPRPRPADDEAPFAALAFKIMTDPFVGQLTFVRVYSGVGYPR